MSAEESQGFVRISCLVADVIRSAEMVKVLSSMTDMDGDFGEPEVFTEWGIIRTDGSARVAMRETYWPKDPDRDCEHWVPAPRFNWKAYHNEDVEVAS